MISQKLFTIALLDNLHLWPSGHQADCCALSLASPPILEVTCNLGGHFLSHQWLLTSSTSVPWPEGFLWPWGLLILVWAGHRCWGISTLRISLNSGRGIRVGRYEPRLPHAPHPGSVLSCISYSVSEDIQWGWAVVLTVVCCSLTHPFLILSLTLLALPLWFLPSLPK